MQRAKIIITGVIAAVLLGAACGGTDFNKTISASNHDRAVLLAAATQTQGAKSAHLSIHASFGSHGVISGEGGIDFEHQNSTFTVDAGPMGQVEQRVVDAVMYLRMGDGKWTKLDLPKGAAGAGTGFSQLDPTKLLDYLRRVSNNVTNEGTETVRGVETTHYRATIDLPGGGSLPIDVWIDDQGYARKATLNADVSGASFNVVFEMYDFGAPVNVQAPPADEVTDPGSGLGGILGGILGG
jgi:hypothetical protein